MLGVQVVFVLGLLTFYAVAPERVLSNQNVDYVNEYSLIAENIANGMHFDYCSQECRARGLAADLADAESRRPPVLPIILSIGLKSGVSKGRLHDWIKWVQFFIGSATVLVFFALVMALAPEENAGLAFIAASAFAMYPAFLYAFKQVNTEPILIFFGLLGLLLSYYAWRSRVYGLYIAVIAGVFFGISYLTKLSGVLFLLGALVGTVVYGGRKKLIIGMLVGFIVVTGGLKASLKTDDAESPNPFVVTVISYGLFWEISEGRQESFERRLLSDEAIQLMRIFKDRYLSGQYKTIEDVSGDFFEEAQSRPLAALNLVGLKIIRSLYASETRLFDKYSMMMNLVVSIVLIYCIWLWYRRAYAVVNRKTRAIGWMLLTTFILFWAMAMIVTPIFRYVLPGYILLFAFLVFLPFVGWRARWINCE